MAKNQATSNLLIYQTEDGKQRYKLDLKMRRLGRANRYFKKSWRSGGSAAKNAAKDKKYIADMKEFGSDDGGIYRY